MYNRYKASGISHILDDFFFIASSASKCSENVARFLFLCKKMNIPINMEKTVAPTTQLTIYGIEVDSIAMECR